MGNVKKVLSIDFDYIMGPSINLYNDMCNCDEAASRVWARIEKERNIEDHLSYDKENLDLLYRLATKAVKGITNTNNVMFAENHDMILDLLCNNSEEVYDIYNVDHHHDIYYNEDQQNDVIQSDFATVGNWVLYLQHKGLLSSYTWARNGNSAKMQEPWEFDYKEIPKSQAKELLLIEYDYVFICGSPQWVPFKFSHLFGILKNVCEVILNKEINEQMGGNSISKKPKGTVEQI